MFLIVLCFIGFVLSFPVNNFINNNLINNNSSINNDVINNTNNSKTNPLDYFEFTKNKQKLLPNKLKITTQTTFPGYLQAKLQNNNNWKYSNINKITKNKIYHNKNIIEGSIPFVMEQVPIFNDFIINKNNKKQEKLHLHLQKDVNDFNTNLFKRLLSTSFSSTFEKYYYY